MKIESIINYNSTKNTQLRKPFKLEITVETVEEVEKLYAIFDYSPIVKTLEINKEANDIRRNVQKGLQNSEGFITFSSNKWFIALKNKVILKKGK